MAGPHDALFKSVFSQPEHAVALILPRLSDALRSHVDMATLQLVPGSFVDEELRERQPCFAVLFHAQRQGLQAPQHEEAVEGRRNAPHGVLEEAHLLDELVVAAHHEPADHVGVAAEILGRTVDTGVGTEFERPLVKWRGKGVIDDGQRPRGPADRRDGRDIRNAAQRV